MCKHIYNFSSDTNWTGCEYRWNMITYQIHKHNCSYICIMSKTSKPSRICAALVVNILVASLLFGNRKSKAHRKHPQATPKKADIEAQGLECSVQNRHWGLGGQKWAVRSSRTEVRAYQFYNTCPSQTVGCAAC